MTVPIQGWYRLPAALGRIRELVVAGASREELLAAIADEIRVHDQADLPDGWACDSGHT